MEDQITKGKNYAPQAKFFSFRGEISPIRGEIFFRGLKSSQNWCKIQGKNNKIKKFSQILGKSVVEKNKKIFLFSQIWKNSSLGKRKQTYFFGLKKQKKTDGTVESKRW